MAVKALPLKDRLVFFRHMHEMISAGITSRDAVATFDTKSSRLKTAVARLRRGMGKGLSLSDAIKPTGLADPMALASLHAGEKSGNLEEALYRVKNDIETAEEFVASLKKSLMMPSINTVGAMGAVMFLSVKVLPKLSETFRKLGDLPAMSEFIFSTADVVHTYWYIFLAAAAACGAVVQWVFRTKPTFLYKTPFIGDVITYHFLSVLFGGLSMAQKAGMSIIEGLRTIEGSLVGYPKTRVKKLIIEMGRGSHFDVAMAGDPFFPRDIIQLVKTARMKGRYEEIMKSLATLCRKRGQNMAQRLGSILEPVALLLVGISVLLMARSVYYPIATIGTGFAPGQ